MQRHHNSLHATIRKQPSRTLLTTGIATTLQHSRSPKDVLSCFLSHLRNHGFLAVRYYHYDAKQGRLVSIDSAGMPADVARALRDGAVIRFLRNTPLKSHDSFWCCAKMQPVLLAVDRPKAVFPLTPEVLLPGILLLYLHADNCRKELQGHKTPHWVDLPLIVAGMCIGKLSCDLDPDIRLIKDALRTPLRYAQELASLVAPILEVMYSTPLTLLARIGEEITNCTTLDGLFDFCTRRLAHTYFDCKYASIFTLSQDSFGSRKLILRKTSFPALQHEQNSGYYSLHERALTAWVVKQAEAVRLHSLNDETALQEQLAAYGRGIGWSNKYRDSRSHTTFLAVPLGTKRVPLGALRYTQKRNGRFTEADQLLLERVARDYLRPRLETLGRSESLPEVVERIQEVHAISLSFTSTHAIPNELCRAMERCFPQRDGAAKLYVINLVDETGTTFQHYAIGGQLTDRTNQQSRYPLVGSFTNSILHAAPNAAVFVNDLPVAHESGGFHLICPSAVCALGCPLLLAGRAFGALVVLSERYDLLEPSQGSALAVLAGETSQLFGLNRILDFSSALRGMRHDCAVLLGKVADMIAMGPDGWKKDAQDLVSFLLETIDTYCSPRARDPKAFAAHDCAETRVREEVLLAAVAAQHEMGNVSGIDCQIDESLVAVVQPSYLMNIVYNLLKNAWAATPAQGPPVVATAAIREGFLEVSITDSGTGMSHEAFMEYNSPDALRVLTFGLPYSRVKGLGLLVARRIAAWHALPDGRTGSVQLCDAEDGRGVRATLRLPVRGMGTGGDGTNASQGAKR